MTVVPYDITAEEVMAFRPDGLFLSNGPGDPTDVQPVIEMVRTLRGRLPIFGICLGHQVISLAYGARTFKMKFGHRGGNHPVKNLETGKVEITSQNHSLCGRYGVAEGHRTDPYAPESAGRYRRRRRMPRRSDFQRPVSSGECARSAGQHLFVR